MEITYFGHSCFRLKGKDITIICDPYSPEIGLRLPKKLEADITTVSHGHYDHNFTEGISSSLIISGPGEYEKKGVFIWGISSFHDKEKGKKKGKNTIYLVEVDGLRICHLGDLGHLLEDEELEDIGKVDILFIPVGGNFTINFKEATAVVSALEPKIVIPMHYQMEKLKIDLEPSSKFCKEMGIPCQNEDKLTLSRKDLPEEEKIVILLSRNL